MVAGIVLGVIAWRGRCSVCSVDQLLMGYEGLKCTGGAAHEHAQSQASNLLVFGHHISKSTRSENGKPLRQHLSVRVRQQRRGELRSSVRQASNMYV